MNQPVFWTCPIWNFEKTLCRFFWKISNSEKFLSSKKFKVQKVPTLNSGWTSLFFEPVQFLILKKHFVDFFEKFQILKNLKFQKYIHVHKRFNLFMFYPDGQCAHKRRWTWLRSCGGKLTLRFVQAHWS